MWKVRWLIGVVLTEYRIFAFVPVVGIAAGMYTYRGVTPTAISQYLRR